MIKLVLFDLDGVLVDAKEIHYTSLNEALGEYAITLDEHRNFYDGRKTYEKLNMLTEKKGLPVSDHEKIFNLIIHSKHFNSMFFLFLSVH